MKMLRVEAPSPDETVRTHGGESEALTRAGHRRLPGDGASRRGRDSGSSSYQGPRLTRRQRSPSSTRWPPAGDEVGSFPRLDMMPIERGGQGRGSAPRAHPPSLFLLLSTQRCPRAQLNLLNPNFAKHPSCSDTPRSSLGWVHPAFNKAECKDAGHFSKSTPEDTFFPKKPILPLP